MHNSFLYKIAHLWNQLSAITRSSTRFGTNSFSFELNSVGFILAYSNYKYVMFL